MSRVRHREIRGSHSSLLLMEIILAVLIFSVACAFLVQMFAKSHTISQKAAATQAAVGSCEVVEQQIRACDNQDQILETVLDKQKDAQKTQEGFVIGYDDMFLECPVDQATYKLYGTFTPKEGSIQVLLEYKNSRDQVVNKITVVHALGKGES